MTFKSARSHINAEEMGADFTEKRAVLLVLLLPGYPLQLELPPEYSLE